MPFSKTARSILTEASQHPLGLAAPLATLPAAARSAVLRSLLRQGLVAAAGHSAQTGHPGLGWRQPDGSMAAMQITDAGQQAVGDDEPRNTVDEAELGGLTQAEYDAKQDFAQQACLRRWHQPFGGRRRVGGGFRHRPRQCPNRAPQRLTTGIYRKSRG